jgi:hypothetical protein
MERQLRGIVWRLMRASNGGGAVGGKKIALVDEDFCWEVWCGQATIRQRLKTNLLTFGFD